MQAPRALGMLLVMGSLLLGAPRGQAGPRDRKIKALEQELARLELRARQALQFRARYLNLRADIYFLERLNRQDEGLLDRVIAYLKTPVSFYEAFLSSVSSSWDRASRARGRYGPGRVTLWLRCRFGLGQVRRRVSYSVRVAVVDAGSGSRVYQRLGPWHNRATRIVTKIAVPIRGIRVAPGRYRLRVWVQVAGKTVSKTIPFVYGRRVHSAPRHRAPPQSGIHSIGNF